MGNPTTTQAFASNKSTSGTEPGELPFPAIAVVLAAMAIFCLGLHRMVADMTHRAFDEQMEALDALKGDALDEAGLELVRKALRGKSNYLAAKAAKLAQENERRELLPELAEAFERFFVNPEKSDPQCWAKNALSASLSKLGCRDRDVFLRGLNFHQMEPMWGGRSDTAGTLRANCAHALVGCDGLIAQDLVLLLLDLLVDKDKSVRVEAVRALAQLGDFAVPALRMRALIPDEEAEVSSVCFQALLAIDQRGSIAFVSRFLAEEGPAAEEAAFALAETHIEAALDELLRVRKSQTHADPALADALLQAIAITRLRRGVDFLLSLIESEDRDADKAIEALARFTSSQEVLDRLQSAVEGAGSPRLSRALADALSTRK
jgi:hypothetical protein